MPGPRFFIPVSLLAALLSSTAAAEGFEKFNDAWRIYVGAFHATVDSRIGINGDVLPPGPPINIEDVLGVEDSKTVAWGGLAWHFARRHSVEAEFFTLNRSASVTRPFEPPLQVGDTILESGTVGTSYDTSVYRVTYGFSALRSERSDLNLKAGLHIASLDANLIISGAICDPTTVPSTPPGCPPLGSSTESDGVSAPLPHFGVSYAYALTPDLAISVAGIGFALEIDNIDGAIFELDADVIWQPFRNFGFGAGYRFFRIDVESRSADLDGKFEFEYHGPMIYVQATF